MVYMAHMALDWKPYGGGYLARNPSHGYYLVYQRSDLAGGSNLWLAKFEASGIQEHPRTTLDLQRFASVEEAKAACEKHAQGFS
jgi:hypothetical protein